MTSSRRRILDALCRRPPDRTPIDFGGHRSSGIAALAYRRLRAHLDLPPRPLRVYDVAQQLAVIDDDVLDRFGADAVDLGRGFALEEEDWSDGTLPDGSPCRVPAWARPERDGNRWILRAATGRIIAAMPEGACFFEPTWHPFHDGPERLDDLETALAETLAFGVAPPPGPVDEDTLRAGALRLRATTGRAILGLFGGSLLECGQALYRGDRFLLMLAAQPRRAHAFLDRLTQLHLVALDRYLAAVGDAIDVIVFQDDLGMQSGPQISPAMYRALFKPRHAALWQRAKQLADVRVMLHCCGGIRPLLPDLIEAGVDAINPVQTNCQGMDADRLKAEFGRELAFWGGGPDSRELLPGQNPEEIARRVRRQVEVLRPGGGFVFQAMQNLLPDVDPENVAAMFDAARE